MELFLPVLFSHDMNASCYVTLLCHSFQQYWSENGCDTRTAAHAMHAEPAKNQWKRTCAFWPGNAMRVCKFAQSQKLQHWMQTFHAPVMRECFETDQWRAASVWNVRKRFVPYPLGVDIQNSRCEIEQNRMLIPMSKWDKCPKVGSGYVEIHGSPHPVPTIRIAYIPVLISMRKHPHPSVGAPPLFLFAESCSPNSLQFNQQIVSALTVDEA